MEKIKFLVLFLLALFLIPIFLSRGLTSPTEEFNVTPDSLLINWSFGYLENITVSSNVDYNFSVKIENSTPSYFLFFNYTNLSRPSTCSITEISDLSYCIWFSIRNESGNYDLINFLTNEKNSTNFTLIFNINGHPPGKYTGKIIISNSSNSSEKVSLDAILNIEIPISENDIGSFKGTFPPNSSQYHSFYFNTSLIENATSLRINFSSSSNAHIFLFANSNLKGKSIENSLNKSIFYQYLSPLEFWEIRAYGNETESIEYHGNLIFSTLNSSISEIDLGVVNVSNESTIKFNLTNVGNLIHPNVSENRVLYFVKKFNYFQPKNFSFLVPDSNIVHKVRISLIWNDNTNYSLILHSPTGAKFESVNNHVYSKFVGAEKEEFLEANAEKGYWIAEVKNYSQVSEYNLTILIQFNASNWIKTNYSNFTFNKINENNSSLEVEFNFTALENSLDGSYEGYLEYLDFNGAGIRIPIKFNLTAPMLIVNNTINSSSVRITENIDANLTKVLNISIKNEGSYNITKINLLNSIFLNCSKNASNFIRITQIEFPENLSVSENSSINITLEIKTNETNDDVCLYKGWIFISTNESEYAAVPYDSFNLTIEVNLTNEIIAMVTGIKTADGDNWINFTSFPENVSVQYLNLFYINGTNITGSLVYFENITETRLAHKNLSYYIPRSGNLPRYNYSSFEDITPGNYVFNFSVPENELGGIYQVLIGIKTANGKLEGRATNAELVINNTALSIEDLDCPIDYMVVDESKTCSVRVKNYGPLATSTAKLVFSENCVAISVNPTERTISLGGFNYNGSLYNFTVTAIANGTCEAWINITGVEWYEDSAKYLTIYVAPKSTTQQENQTISLPVYIVDLSFIQTENLINVVQNLSNYTVVKVKNTGNITADISFSVEGINSTWYSINTSNYSKVRVNSEVSFLVNFSIENEKIGDYSGIFKAKGINDLWNLEKTISSSFKLRILPSEETKTKIDEAIASLEQNATLFATQISDLKEKDYNTTLVEVLFSEFLIKIQEAKNYTQNGDYISANSLIEYLIRLEGAIEEGIKNAEKIIKEKEEKERGEFQLKTILISIGAACGIVLVYLFWPVKPKKFYILKKEVKKIKKEEIWKNLRERWDKLFEERIKRSKKK